MKIFKEKAGVISKDPCWVCFHSYYMYTSDSLLGLIWYMIRNWKSDHNLIG